MDCDSHKGHGRPHFPWRITVSKPVISKIQATAVLIAAVAAAIEAAHLAGLTDKEVIDALTPFNERLSESEE